MPAGCVRCAEVEGRAATPGGVIHDDGLWHVTHHPGAYTDPGELIVKTRRHCESVADLTAEEAAALGPVLRAAVGVIEQVVGPERVYVLSFGERVRHLHFFLLPRTRDLPAGGTAQTVLAAMLSRVESPSSARSTTTSTPGFAVPPHPSGGAPPGQAKRGSVTHWSGRLVPGST